MQFPSAEEIIKGLKPEMDGLHKAVDDRFNTLRSRISDLEAANGRRGLGGGWQGDEDRGEFNKSLRAYLKHGDASGLHKAMSVGSDPQGGYFLPEPLARTITSTIFNSSPVRQISRAVEISSDAFEELVDKDEPAASWVAETGSRDETAAPEIGRLRIPAHEIYCAPRVTQKLLDDSSIDLAAWLSQKIADKFSRAEATSFVSGDGINKPRGFLTYPISTLGDSTRSWGTVQYAPTGASGAFAGTNPGDCLVDLMFSLKAGYRANGIWAMNSKTLASVRKLKDGQSNYLWQQSVIASEPSLLLGHRVVVFEDLPDIASNSLSIVFGDFFRSYTICDRLPMRALRDELTAKPFVIFYVTRRVGGDLVNTESVKFLRFSAS